MIAKLIREALCKSQKCSAWQFLYAVHYKRGLLLEMPFEILSFFWMSIDSSLICNIFNCDKIDLKDLETYDPGSWIITSTTGSQHQNNIQNSSTMRRRSSKSPPADDSLRFDFSLKMPHSHYSDLSFESGWDNIVTFWQKIRKLRNILFVTSYHQFICRNYETKKLFTVFPHIVSALE